MATLQKGYLFGATEQVTNAKLHSLVDSGSVSGIQTADISDAQITNAKINDVSGAKFTGLANIPSGAGVIPSANVTSVAQKGANSDITSLSGLTTPLSVAQGGTGTTNSNSANGVVILDGSNKLPVSDGSNLTGVTTVPATGSVTSTMLKTATSEVSTTAQANLTFAGGQYCFYPQIKFSIANGNVEVKLFANSGEIGTSYVTNINIYGNSGGTNSAIARYVTSSGIDYWLWILIDKITKKTISMAGAPDHVAYGNGDDFDKLPHPFRDYKPDTQEIILVEKIQAKEIQLEAKQKHLSVLELVEKNYKVDFSKTYPYVPIHSGQYSPDEKPVLVKSIPDYIQVRKLRSIWLQ